MIVATMRVAHAVETARQDRVGKIAGEAVRARLLDASDFAHPTGCGNRREKGETP
jgi:hypothetical protein